MKKVFQIILLSCITIAVYPQHKSEKLKTIGVSIPVIWNNSEATFYRLGSRYTPSGKAVSYGVNINHTRTLYKNLYGVVGVGYFKQVFGIIRPFDYDSPNNFGYSTETYNYDNIQFYGGLGYKLRVAKLYHLNVNFLYNQFYSFRQKYINRSPNPKPQINNKFISLGSLINISTGIERNITKKIDVGLQAFLPIATHWKNDEIFYNLGWSTDEQQIGRTKFSLGISFLCNYHFNN